MLYSQALVSTVLADAVSVPISRRPPPVAAEALLLIVSLEAPL